MGEKTRPLDQAADDRVSENERLVQELEKHRRVIVKLERERDNAKSYAERLRRELEAATREAARLRRECSEWKSKAEQHDNETVDMAAYYERRAAEARAHAVEKDKSNDGDQAEDSPTAAAAIMANAGLVYDVESGLYYDWAQGYCYDPKTELYYSPHYNAYYTRDATTGEYAFHSYPVDPKADTAHNLLRLRLVVQASPCLDLGGVHVFERSGGTIGREKTLKHTLRIPDLEVSKAHASIRYHDDTPEFTLTDEGSRNGTFVNGERLEASVARALAPGDIVVMGGTSFAVHLHAGHEFCDECRLEGDARRSGQGASFSQPPVTYESSSSPADLRRLEMNRLKRKYGMWGGAGDSEGGYTDRAARRRMLHDKGKRKAGLDGDQPLAKNNKGRRMLDAMGYEGGGPDPIRAVQRPKGAGLGAA